MAKTQDKTKDQAKEKSQAKEKDQKRKDRKELIGRVKKVIKKSRRKLTEDKFEKELQRTIVFLEQLQKTLGSSNGNSAKAVAKSAPEKAVAEKAKPVVAVAVKKAARKPAAKTKK